MMIGLIFVLLSGTVAIHAETNNLQENIAIRGRAQQSSTLFFGPNAAIDECDSCCTYTGTETNPWWRLDLMNSKSIKEVVVTGRIAGAEIRVGNSLDNNGTNNPICAKKSGIPAGQNISYECSGLEGQYVNVVIPGDSKSLGLCEVKVYETDQFFDNVTLKGNAVQSSIFKYWHARHAIDGIKPLPGKSSMCTHTIWENNPWWRLDLLDNYYINKVTITNRGDCCPERINGAEIRIGNSLDNNGNNNPRCAVIDSIPAGASYNYSCPELEGRFVNVVIPGNNKILTLCEVEVYGFLSVRKNIVRMKFVSTSDPDNDKLLYELQSALALRGITDVKMSWTKLPQQEQKRDVEDEEGPCEIIQ